MICVGLSNATKVMTFISHKPFFVQDFFANLLQKLSSGVLIFLSGAKISGNKWCYLQSVIERALRNKCGLRGERIGIRSETRSRYLLSYRSFRSRNFLIPALEISHITSSGSETKTKSPLILQQIRCGSFIVS